MRRWGIHGYRGSITHPFFLSMWGLCKLSSSYTVPFPGVSRDSWTSPSSVQVFNCRSPSLNDHYFFLLKCACGSSALLYVKKITKAAPRASRDPRILRETTTVAWLVIVFNTSLPIDDVASRLLYSSVSYPTKRQRFVPATVQIPDFLLLLRRLIGLDAAVRWANDTVCSMCVNC